MYSILICDIKIPCTLTISSTSLGHIRKIQVHMCGIWNIVIHTFNFRNKNEKCIKIITPNGPTASNKEEKRKTLKPIEFYSNLIKSHLLEI